MSDSGGSFTATFVPKEPAIAVRFQKWNQFLGMQGLETIELTIDDARALWVSLNKAIEEAEQYAHR